MLKYFIYSPRGRRLHCYGTRAANEPVVGVWTLDEWICSIGMCTSSKGKQKAPRKTLPSSSCPSSGATTKVAVFGLPSELGDSSAVGRGGAGRSGHDQQHCYLVGWFSWKYDDARTCKLLTLNWNITCSILIYIQQDATLRSLFYLETALPVSGGTTTHHQKRKTTVSTASGICHTVTAICRYSGS